MALATAVITGYGVFLMFTAHAFGWRGIGIGPRAAASWQPMSVRVQDWMVQAGLADVRPRDFAATLMVVSAAGAAAGFAIFGGVLAPAIVSVGLASVPVTFHRARREKRRIEAREAWPRMIDEVRVLTGSLGRSIPQALLEVGRRGPAEMQPAFAAAQREWLISTDFGRTVSLLKTALADPTADAACETLLVANEIGGSDLEGRLAALVEDRTADLQGRKEARSRQAGVRFARRFVLLVPLGMAVAGLSIGEGRRSYGTQSGQIGVAVSLGMIAVCWAWAGRLLKLPDEERVFAESDG